MPASRRPRDVIAGSDFAFVIDQATFQDKRLLQRRMLMIWQLRAR
ncbi:MAG: hypothetical protein JWM42_1253, partial [Burkholderia sp.]|nr:hypothetical protein [Burkholderia sp.]